MFLGSNKITLADFGYKYIYMFIYNFIRSLTLFLSEIQSKYTQIYTEKFYLIDNNYIATKEALY